MPIHPSVYATARVLGSPLAAGEGEGMSPQAAQGFALSGILLLGLGVMVAGFILDEPKRYK